MSTSNLTRPGLRRGNQTGLCSHIFRLLRKRRVPWVLLENVPGLLYWHMIDDPPQPPAVSHVVAELESLGYRWAHRVVGLTGFGVPQRRRRVFILASTHGDPRDPLLAPQTVCLGQCLDLAGRRRERSRRESTHSEDDDANENGDACGSLEFEPSREDAIPDVAEGPECVECAVEAVGVAARRAKVAISRVAAGGRADAGAGSAPDPSTCTHAPRECYDCFHTPPFVQPRRTFACVDLAEKRHGPMFHELYTLTTANGKRMALVEDLGAGRGRARMLHVNDAERLMGFPAGWTEPCYPLNLPGRPARAIDRSEGDSCDASVAKRLEKLGIAVAVPQARWIGERLAKPYDLKFARAGDGVRFKIPIPGGPNAAPGGQIDKRRGGGGGASGRVDVVVGGGGGGDGENAAADVAARDGDSAAERTPAPAPVSAAREEAAAAASGWPECAWNVDPESESWRGRRALHDCGDAPVARGFVPLGDFLVDFDDAPEVSPEQAAGYIERLRYQHADIEPFVARGLGWRAPKQKKTEAEPANGPGPAAGGVEPAVVGDRTEHLVDHLGSRRPPPRSTVGVAHPQPVAAAAAGAEALAAAEEAEDSDASRGGRVVWVPVVVGRSGGSGANARTPCYWPGLCLHMDDDRDLIPESAVAALRPEHAAETHRLAVYFGDKTFEWRRADELLEYAEHADDIIASQSHVRHRVRYRRALEEAEEWWRRQRRARETPAARAAATARDAAEAKLRRAVGAAVAGGGGGALAPTPCGACRVCRSAARAATELPFSPRHRARACAKPSTLAPLRGVRDSEECPQLDVILAARSGHVGANVALLRERAVGRRVAVHWPNERRPFRGVVAGFDPETYTHRVEYDDGDVEPAARLWRETVHLRVPEDDAADREERAARAMDDDDDARDDAGKPEKADEDEPEGDRVDDEPDDERTAAEVSRRAEAPGRVESAAKKTRGAKRKAEEESAREVTRPRGDASSRRPRGGGSGGRPWW